MTTNRSASVAASHPPTSLQVSEYAAFVRPRCAVCNAPVRRVDARAHGNGVELTVTCHRTEERVYVSAADVQAGHAAGRTMVVFLRAAATYGRVSPEARRERRACR